jgi:4-amino-4-deoxy-L-arabinose transferase-like glycosyltransferase
MRPLYLELSLLRRYLPVFTLAVALAALYLYNLNGVGVLSTDEPRYAAIGIAMAHGGGLITPKLWGSPWFEKPPLLYWMTAAGSATGLSPDLAGRLPVALLSIIFLALCFILLKREFGPQAAAAATVMLATSAGWLAYSGLCLTDIPLAVFFSLATFLCLPLLQTDARPETWRFLLIGACLGLATLAKGLVPLALAAPWAWFLRRHWRHWWLSGAAFAIVALPWYVAVYEKNGYIFVQEFFIRHHFERLYSASLQHVQPWYYYVPVLLAGLFPWTPALVLLPLERSRWDARRQFLLGTVCFGLVFFSISLNKLPGYLMPLLPPLFALIGARYQDQPVARTSRVLFFACALLIAIVPLLTSIIPQSLAHGRFTPAALGDFSRTTFFYVAVPLAIVLLARRAWVAPLLVLALAAGGLYVKSVVYPVLDREVSARSLWQQLQTRSNDLCDAGTNRDWIYGLNFYRGSEIPPCRPNDTRIRIQAQGHNRPQVVP